jgi:serine/threonine protein phosphatase PrpC
MSVDPSEPIEGQRGSFTNAFSPRVLGMHFSQVDTNQNGYSFEVRIAHFDLLSGRFKESKVQVLLEADQVRKIEPPLIGARDFQQALKQFCKERISGYSSASTTGEIPIPVLERLMSGLQDHIGERQCDGRENKQVTANDRLDAQIELQREDRWSHDLVILGRYHKRRSDFLGGNLNGINDAAFGYTTGRVSATFVKELSEDALGIDRVGDMEIFAVADGHHGSRSSELAICKLLELFRLGYGDGSEYAPEESVPRFLMNAFFRCHKAILTDLKSETSMTSLAAAVRQGNRLWWASVSDSFIFCHDGDKVNRINRDLGFEVTGKNLSIWLGDKKFHPRYIDSGYEDAQNRSFFLATDGILTHPRHRVRSLIGDLSSETNLDDLSRKIAEDYAIGGDDNTSFILLRGSQETGSA